MKPKSKTVKILDKIKYTILFILLICGIIAFLASCRTLKQKEITETEIKANVNTSITEKSDVKNNVAATVQLDRKTSNQSQVTDNSSTQEITEETSETTNFSKPDSTGKQYPTSKNTTKKTTKKSENKNIKSSDKLNDFEKTVAGLEDHSQIQTEAKKDSTDKSKTKTTNQSDINQKTNTPLWVTIISSLSVIIVLGAIVYFTYLIFKRYNLIK